MTHIGIKRRPPPSVLLARTCVLCCQPKLVKLAVWTQSCAALALPVLCPCPSKVEPWAVRQSQAESESASVGPLLVLACLRGVAGGCTCSPTCMCLSKMSTPHLDTIVRIDATVTAVLSFAPAAVKLTHARSPRARSPGPGRVLAAVPAAVIVTVSTQASLSLSMPLTDHDHFVASAAILASVSETGRPNCLNGSC